MTDTTTKDALHVVGWLLAPKVQSVPGRFLWRSFNTEMPSKANFRLAAYDEDCYLPLADHAQATARIAELERAVTLRNERELALLDELAKVEAALVEAQRDALRYRRLRGNHMAAVSPPLAWIRKHPDGTYADELLPHRMIEDVRKSSGAWEPLGPLAAPVAQPPVPEGRRPVPKAALVDLLNLIDPPPIELDGKVRVFVNPNAAEILRRINAIVRAMLAAAPTPGAENHG
jgi:hypothetical protein